MMEMHNVPNVILLVQLAKMELVVLLVEPLHLKEMLTTYAPVQMVSLMMESMTNVELVCLYAELVVMVLLVILA